MQIVRSLLLLVSTCLLQTLPTTCVANDSVNRSSSSSISIESIDPPLTQPIHRGELLEITAVVDYVLANDKGDLGVFIQNDEGYSLTRICDIPAISPGKGTVTVRAYAKVTDTKKIQFIVTLYHDDITFAVVKTNLSYRVEEYPMR